LPDTPGDILAVDISGSLPKATKGYRYVLVAMDLFSKYVKLYSMQDQKLDSIIDCLKNGFFEEIEIPKTILTVDNLL